MISTNLDYYKIKNSFLINEHIESVKLYGEYNDNAEVSIMIPTYLRNDYLKKTIESVLNQKTSYVYNIIVVDNNPNFNDSSTLELLKKINSNKILYFKNKENLGMFGNWNRCIELSKTKWLLILHDDDEICDHYIETMMRFTKKDNDLSCIGCNHIIIDENSNIKKKSLKHRIFNRLFSKKFFQLQLNDFYYIHPINIMGMFLNREKAIEIGGFDDDFKPCSDYIFILKMIKNYRVYFTDLDLFMYRVAVNASLTVNNLIGMIESDALMRKYINDKEKYSNEKDDLLFRNCVAYLHEKELEDNWFKKLSDEQKEIVVNEYNAFNQVMKFKTPTKKEIKKCLFNRRLYKIKMRLFRR